MSSPLPSMLHWIMDEAQPFGKRVYSIGNLNFLLTDEQRRAVTSPACIKAMQTADLQRSGVGANKRTGTNKGAIDFGYTCYTGPTGRWFFTLNGNALSEIALENVRPSDRKKINCHRVMYRRKGSGILDTVLGPIIRAWITSVECVLKMWDYENYKVMHAACQPVTLNTGEVFDVRIPGINDNVLFNGTFNHHTYDKEGFAVMNCEEDESNGNMDMPVEIIGVHQDRNDHMGGIAVTTDGVGPDPEALKGGQLHLYNGDFKPKKRMRGGKKKGINVSDLPDKSRVLCKPVGQTAIAKLHEIWHYVSPGTLCKPVDTIRWSFIAQQKQDVIDQLAWFRKNPDVLIVTTEEKNTLRSKGLIPASKKKP